MTKTKRAASAPTLAVALRELIGRRISVHLAQSAVSSAGTELTATLVDVGRDYMLLDDRGGRALIVLSALTVVQIQKP